MRRVRVVNRSRGAILGDRVAVADRWWPRFRGLLGRDCLPAGEGLLLTPCRSIHMLGMRFPLDAAFLDASGRVVALYPGLAPGRATRWHRGAQAALELPAGTLAATGTGEGDLLETTPSALGATG
jgi:uncharacterized membrane protein (UPF0127 family)